MVERTLTINISKAKGTDRPKRARKAMNIIKSSIERHTKAVPLIGQNLNKEIWKHGGKKVPTKIKITVDVEDDFAKAELFGHKFDEKNKEDLRKEAEAKTKKTPKKDAKKEEGHEHDHHDKLDGTEDVPDEVKESHKQDAVTESKEAEEEMKANTKTGKDKRMTREDRSNEPKS